MNKKGLLASLHKLGVIQTGHFRLTSGLHSPEYVQCAKLFERPQKASLVLQDLLDRLPGGIETVIAPAIGGITVGYELARLLKCRFIFAERENGRMALRRGFKISAGEKLLVAEDVVTTGGSVREVIDLIKTNGGSVLGVAAVMDRSGGQAAFRVPFWAAAELNIEVYEPASCPLCAADMPLTKPGSS
ncbi:MAG TPA: orotate phosphoribosyltransferase [Firmicutes bacterium]|nr:orotate phosphoribosyltransferase [Bacillota bacterium]